MHSGSAYMPHNHAGISKHQQWLDSHSRPLLKMAVYWFWIFASISGAMGSHRVSYNWINNVTRAAWVCLVWPLLPELRVRAWAGREKRKNEITLVLGNFSLDSFMFLYTLCFTKMWPLWLTGCNKNTYIPLTPPPPPPLSPHNKHPTPKT